MRSPRKHVYSWQHWARFLLLRASSEYLVVFEEVLRKLLNKSFD